MVSTVLLEVRTAVSMVAKIFPTLMSRGEKERQRTLFKKKKRGPKYSYMNSGVHAEKKHVRSGAAGTADATCPPVSASWPE